jgi:THAP4-like, heme-binding beta-barrel domain
MSSPSPASEHDPQPDPRPADPQLAELHPALAPLAALVGSWSGTGVGGYPDLDADFVYDQVVTFTPLPGKPVLGYQSRTWAADDSRPLATEVGFWRMPDATTVEVMLAHPFGIVEVYVGDLSPTATGFKIELSDNITVRTATARHVDRSQRLYGLVEGDLAYAVDMAAEGYDMTPHLSAKLKRTES